MTIIIFELNVLQKRNSLIFCPKYYNVLLMHSLKQKINAKEFINFLNCFVFWERCNVR